MTLSLNNEDFPRRSLSVFSGLAGLVLPLSYFQSYHLLYVLFYIQRNISDPHGIPHSVAETKIIIITVVERWSSGGRITVIFENDRLKGGSLSLPPLSLIAGYFNTIVKGTDEYNRPQMNRD